jgi:hypothetical protein
MDHERFDDMTKALATGTSRRRVLKGLAGAALGTVFGAGVTARADAEKPTTTASCKTVADCPPCHPCANAVCFHDPAISSGFGTGTCRCDGRCPDKLTATVPRFLP